MKHQNARAEAFYALPENERLGVVARLFERRHRLAENHDSMKITVSDDAKKLGLHSSVLERVQGIARAKGLIQTIYNYETVDLVEVDRFIAAVDDPDALSNEAARVMALLQERAHRKCVIPVKGFYAAYAGTSRRFEDRLRLFGKNAASLVLTILKPAKFLGITWGSTLQHIVHSLDPTCLDHQAEIFPLTGAMPEIQEHPSTSSKLVEWIEARRRPRTSPYSLRGVWPAVHKDLQRHELIESMFSSPDYNKIFGKGDKNSLVDQMDCILTSIGRDELPWGMGLDALLHLVAIAREDLNSLAAGDIAGVLLPRRHPPLSASERKEFRKVQRSWIGLTMAHLKAVVKKGQSSHAPGVCVVATGHRKAAFLLDLMDRGLVSHAIVDESLLKVIGKLVNSTKPPERK